MEKIETKLPGLYELRPRVFKDSRGWFTEALNLDTLAKVGIELPPFVQINHSKTAAHTFRGLHYQAPPFAQAKYVRCIGGHLSDIVVDIRKGSPTYGKWCQVGLSSGDGKVLYVPPGFAHGFYAITECELEYAVFGAGYNKDAEGGLRVDDPAIGIPWSEMLGLMAQWHGPCSMNARDSSWPSFATFESPFVFEGEKEKALP